MATIQQVHIEPRSIEQFGAILGQAAVWEMEEHAASLVEALGGCAVWNINSTASGGGVAEMLSALLGFPRALRIDARWAVIEGTPDFFVITKRLHHALHGSPGDGSMLGEEQQAVFELVSRENAAELRRLIRPGDVVILHDPQTAGLAPHMIEHGCPVVWRCHIGDDHTNAESERGWAFLSRYLADVEVSIFSRHAYVPPSMSRKHTLVVPPSIDPFSPKSEMLDEVTIQLVLARAGLIAGDGTHGPVEFAASDGSLRYVDREATLVSANGPPTWETPLVLQVSRWDPLKDPAGVMDAFARTPPVASEPSPHLMLVGPEVTGVADDPEATAVFEATISHWQSLDPDVRQRVHLASLPTADRVENATIVNALQSHARITVQKSIREGFGLTVTEAMWKGCPVVASKVGGIQDQIDDHVEGLLIDDPRDLDAVAEAIHTLLTDKALAARLGAAARRRVIKDYLPPRHLLQYAELIEDCLLAG